MRRDDLVRYRVDQLLAKHFEYDFDQFITTLRVINGLSMATVSRETGLRHSRIFYLEHGQFSKRPSASELAIVAEYYAIDSGLLDEKVSEFLREGRNKPKCNRKAV